MTELSCSSSQVVELRNNTLKWEWEGGEKRLLVEFATFEFKSTAAATASALNRPHIITSMLKMMALVVGCQ